MSAQVEDRHREAADRWWEERRIFEEMAGSLAQLLADTEAAERERSAARIAELESRAEWALAKLREMNIQAGAMGREWYRASRGAPRKPRAPLNIKNPSSVVAWLRYLAWRVRSERGSVLAYERLKSQARADAPRLLPHGKSLAETYGTGAHSRVGVPWDDVHAPSERGKAKVEAEVASPASGGGEDGTAFKDGVEHAAMKLEAIGERSLACFVRFVAWPPRELTQQERDYALTLTPKNEKKKGPDRQKLDQALKGSPTPGTVPDQTSDEVYHELEAERDALRSEVERLRAESAWVPCSERMPEEHSLVLVTVTGLGHDESPRLSGVAWVSAGKWIGGGSGRPIVHQTVVAWRPLPAPYQEDSNVAS